MEHDHRQKEIEYANIASKLFVWKVSTQTRKQFRNAMSTEKTHADIFYEPCTRFYTIVQELSLVFSENVIRKKKEELFLVNSLKVFMPAND